MLEGVGLTVEEEETYLGLLSSPGQTVDDILARHPDRSRQQTVAVLARLLDHGLATQLAGTPVRYTGIAPDVALGSLASARIDDARRVQQAIPGLMERFWSGRHGVTNVQSVEVVLGREATFQRWVQLGRAASKEIRGFDCPPYFGDPTQLDPMETERLQNDICCRAIYDQKVLDVPGRWADIEAGIALGEQARVHPNLPAKLTLFDDFAATLSNPGPDGRAASLVVVRQSPLLDALSALFEAYWERAVPLVLDGTGNHTANRTGNGAAPRAVTEERETRLVQLLSAGLGDDAIQRALGVSASTVQRGVRNLMARVGAKTRFQAGLQVGRGALARPRDGTG